MRKTQIPLPIAPVTAAEEAASHQRFEERKQKMSISLAPIERELKRLQTSQATIRIVEQFALLIWLLVLIMYTVSYLLSIASKMSLLVTLIATFLTMLVFSFVKRRMRNQYHRLEVEKATLISNITSEV